MLAIDKVCILAGWMCLVSVVLWLLASRPAAWRSIILRLPWHIYNALGARAALDGRTLHEQVIHILRVWYLGEQTQDKMTTPLSSGETTCSDEEA
jgi:hypothetical protein